MATGNTLQMSIKILLISTGLILLAILFSSADIPAIYSAFKSWLRPPYLYFIINGIIITIVASSRLHHHATTPSLESDTHAPPPLMERDVHAPEQQQQQQQKVSMLVKDVDVEEIKEVMVAYEVRKPLEYEIVEESVGLVADAEAEAEAEVEAVGVDKFIWGSKPPVPLARQEALVDLISQRPPAVSRFGHNRRPAKGPIGGGKVLRKVAKPKKQDTLESTWKAITEGRHIPLTRHLKKSDTWENNNNNNNNNHQIDLLNDLPPIQEVKKSQTFTDRTNYTSPRVTPSITKLKKEPSLGQDELNRRVEAFINKFNEDMRLQRQQSMQQFMEMINRAA